MMGGMPGGMPGGGMGIGGMGGMGGMGQHPLPFNTKPPGQQMQQQHAISYVTTIRNRFANEPDTYRSFLKILHTYQKEQKGIKDVLEQVSQLFADHPDLLMEFTYFLPDAVQEQAKERLHRAARESEIRRRNMLAGVGQGYPGHVNTMGAGSAKTAGMGGHGPHGGMDKGAGGKRSRAEMLEKSGPQGKKGAGGPMNVSTQGLTTAQARKVARKKTAGGMVGEESMMMMGQGHGGMGHVGHTHFFANKEGGKVSHGTDRYRLAIPDHE